jgi:CRISPR/Cas system CSM-associated protein Csm5 (group 7 of RAMP superfamily)
MFQEKLSVDFLLENVKCQENFLFPLDLSISTNDVHKLKTKMEEIKFKTIMEEKNKKNQEIWKQLVLEETEKGKILKIEVKKLKNFVEMILKFDH